MESQGSHHKLTAIPGARVPGCSRPMQGEEAAVAGTPESSVPSHKRKYRRTPMVTRIARTRVLFFAMAAFMLRPAYRASRHRRHSLRLKKQL